MTSKKYNLKNIKTLLIEGFTEDELRGLAFFESDFEPFYDKLPKSASKDEIIRLLVEYAARRVKVDELLAWAKEANPNRYERHQPYAIPAPEPPKKPTPEPSKPKSFLQTLIEKRSLSWLWVGIGVVVLVIIIIGLIFFSNNPTTQSYTPRETKEEAVFFNRLVEKQDFPTGQDQNGRSWYEDGGYNILALDTKNWWMWPMPNKQFKDFVMEVDALPITKGSITGYVLAVGWSKGGNYHAFAVKPDGECGFGKLEKNLGPMLYNLKCPSPTENQKVLVRLEVGSETQGNSKTCMRAFIDKQYIGERCFTDYEGGLIGLGVYNGGQTDSGVEAQVRFNNLTIWDLPVE